MVLALGLLVLHVTWALGGTWGRSLCGDRGVTATEAADGCAAHPATAAEWATGWSGVVWWVAVTVLLAAHRRGRMFVGATVAASAALVTVAFPLHLPFEVAGGLMGQPCCTE